VIATTTDTGSGNTDVSEANLAILDCSTLSQSPCCIFVELVMVKNPEFAVRISTLSVIVPEIISGFGGHIAIFGCWSLLQSLADTISSSAWS